MLSGDIFGIFILRSAGCLDSFFGPCMSNILFKRINAFNKIGLWINISCKAMILLGR